MIASLTRPGRNRGTPWGLGAAALPALVLSALLALVAVVPVPGQDASPKADQPASAGEPGAAAEQAKPEEETPAEAPATQDRMVISLGYLSPDIDGNGKRFRQYISPPSGFFVAMLGVIHPLDEHGMALEGYAYDLAQPGAGGTLRFYSVPAGVRIDLHYRGSEFYRDWDPGAHQVARRDLEVDGRYRIARDDYFRGYYRTLCERGGDAGDPADNYADDRGGASYSRHIGGFSASAGYDFEAFRFPAGGPRLTGQVNTWSASFGSARDSRTLVSASFRTGLTELDTSAVRPAETSAALTGTHAFTPTLSVTGDLAMWQLGDAVTANAYAKSEQRASLEAEWGGIPKTVLRAGAETARVGYVNGDHSQVVRPAVNTVTVGLRSRPWKPLKIDADFRCRRVDERPLALPFPGIWRETLIWSQTDHTRVRATYAAGDARFGITGGWAADRRENPEQGTKSGITTRDLTTWWSITPRVIATASAMNQTFGLRGVGGAAPFLSFSQSWTIGATWQPDGHTSVSSSFARSDSFGAIEQREQTFALSADCTLREYRFRLSAVLDDLRDFNGTGLSYGGNLFYAEISTSVK